MPKKKKTARTKRQALAEYEKLRKLQKKMVMDLKKISEKLQMCHFPPFGPHCK
jgi:hypothetical protein